MKHTKKILLVTVSVIGLSLVLGLVTSRQARATVSALVTVANGSTNPVVTSSLGSPSSVLVSLTCVNVSSFSPGICTQWSLTTAGGTVQSNYSVPSGYYLVITDIECSGTDTPGTLETLAVTVNDFGRFWDVVTSDSIGVISFREHLTTGIAFSAMPVVGMSGSPVLRNLTIQGYLTPSTN
jgi:hypothetical protein